MGPLAGYRVVELAGIGPAPFCATLLSDMGAEVLRVDRVEPSGLGISQPKKFDLLSRNRRCIAVDLKKPEGTEAVLRLCDQADALIEGFRPGVMERLGLGPEVCLKRNPKLVFGRMTGFGQDGPMALAAGHDINYIALAGSLAHIGRQGQPPTPPLNLVGDFGGGGMFLAVGVLAALLEAGRSGKGQVVDAAMVDGAAYLTMPFFGMWASGLCKAPRGENILDSGAPFYDVYETSDGKYISIGSIEPKFYAELIQKLGLERDNLPAQMDRVNWPMLKQRFAEAFRRKTRAEWVAIMQGTDICFAPVLEVSEVNDHPHNKARKTFIEIDGVVQPGPAPRFSRSKAGKPTGASVRGQHTEAALADWGFDRAEIQRLKQAGAVKQA